MKSRLVGCIFDLDGTLVDSLEDLQACLNAVLLRRGFPAVERDRLKELVGDGIGKLVERAIPREAFSPQTAAACLREFTDEYRIHCLDRTRPFDGMYELVRRVRAGGIFTAVVTNKDEAIARRIVSTLFGADGFDWVAGLREGGRAKPDPQSVLDVCRRLGAGPEDCVMVGDSGGDMKTGRNAGMPAIGVTWGYRPRRDLEQNGAARIVNTPDQLWAALSEER